MKQKIRYMVTNLCDLGEEDNDVGDVIAKGGFNV